MVSSVHPSTWVYLGTVVCAAVAVALVCFGVNALVDPLWYFRGNVLTGVNYAFDERTAKMIRFVPRMTDYDCLLIGSSHTALLHERSIESHRCFNLGFAHGRVAEFLAYAKYIRARGFRPTLILVNVDLYDFQDLPDALTIPDFIRMGDDPPSALRTYLSLDALNFSLRTLRGAFPNHLIYDPAAQLHIIPKVKPYRPPHHLAAPVKPPLFHSNLVAAFAELRQVFPEACAIAWVPPISAWTIAQLQLDGMLGAYLEALRNISLHYDELLDFSVPSEVTASTTNTFDGIHYIDAVNARVLAALISGRPDFGVDWRRQSASEIAALYQARLAELVFHPPAVSHIPSAGSVGAAPRTVAGEPMP